MSTIQLELPADLRTELSDRGLLDDSRISKWVAEAIRERISTERQRSEFEQRANRADRGAILEVLAKVADAEPADEDRW